MGNFVIMQSYHRFTDCPEIRSRVCELRTQTAYHIETLRALRT